MRSTRRNLAIIGERKPIFFKRVGEDRTFYLAFEDVLDGDTLTDSPTSSWTSGITEQTSATRVGAITLEGVAYTANTVISFVLSGGTEGEIYIGTIDVNETTSGDRLEVEVEVRVIAEYDEAA